MTTTFDEDREQDDKPLSPPKALNEQPGGLRSETRMTLQTRQAQKLVLGRRRAKDVQPIVGLLDFGRRMKLLWLSSRADDPYADWYLLQIEESINEAKVLITEKKQWLDDVLQSMSGFDIEVAQSLEPIKVPIVFQNPYGYMGAYLIADYDALCCSIFTASHIGLIDRKTSVDLTAKAGKAIRRTFNLAVKWKFTGVTRDDIAAETPVAQSAIATYGDCPKPVLDKTRRAKISPGIQSKPKVVVAVKEKKLKQLKLKKTSDKPDETRVKDVSEKREAAAVEGLDSMFGLG